MSLTEVSLLPIPRSIPLPLICRERVIFIIMQTITTGVSESQALPFWRRASNFGRGSTESPCLTNDRWARRLLSAKATGCTCSVNAVVGTSGIYVRPSICSSLHLGLHFHDNHLIISSP